MAHHGPVSVGLPGFAPHVSVWLLVAGVVALGVYAVRLVGPNVVDAEQVVTRRQRFCFVAAVVLLWAAADWPVHDVAERYLYAVHMAQHLIFTLAVPPLFLLATPTWLARAILRPGRPGDAVFRRLAHPVVAGAAFNAVIAASHIPAVVDLSVRSRIVHYSAHLALVATATLMWLPVCGPVPEWRLTPPGQMLYLFVMSIVPTVPAAWLIFAEDPVYRVYDVPNRLFGIDVIVDQQLAGLLMKLGGGMFLWGIIAVLFFRWAAADQRPTPLSDRGNGARPSPLPDRQAPTPLG